jgi:expansin (peptidoglycan-binding protein)
VTAHRLLAPRWLATGGAVVLAGVLGVALLLQNGGSACAAVPSTTAKSGKATFYDLGSGMGNCSFPSAPANDLFVALGAADYSGGAACGGYLDVTGPKGKVRVKVIDSCPPCGPGHIDLSRTAFKKIADEIDGIVPVKYKAVPGAAVPGPISVRIKEGSSRYWFAALIDNHANPLASVKVASGSGSFKTASRTDFNYWIIESGAGAGPFKIKTTDVYGTTTTVAGIKLAPGTTQKTSTRVGGSGSAAAAAPKPAKKKASASPPPSASKAAPSPSPSGSSAAPLPEATEVPASLPAAVALAAAAPTPGSSCG